METQAINLIIGAVLPPFIDMLNRYVKNSNVRYLISLVISIAIGAVVSYQDLDAANVLASAGLVFGAAQSTYNLYWKNSDVRKKIVK